MQFMWFLMTSMTKSYEISQYAYRQTPTNVVLFLHTTFWSLMSMQMSLKCAMSVVFIDILHNIIEQLLL